MGNRGKGFEDAGNDSSPSRRLRLPNGSFGGERRNAPTFGPGLRGEEPHPLRAPLGHELDQTGGPPASLSPAFPRLRALRFERVPLPEVPGKRSPRAPGVLGEDNPREGIRGQR